MLITVTAIMSQQISGIDVVTIPSAAVAGKQLTTYLAGDALQIGAVAVLLSVVLVLFAAFLVTRIDSDVGPIVAMIMMRDGVLPIVSPKEVAIFISPMCIMTEDVRENVVLIM